jgi:L-rhamnose mutarotase
LSSANELHSIIWDEVKDEFSAEILKAYPITILKASKDYFKYALRIKEHDEIIRFTNCHIHSVHWVTLFGIEEAHAWCREARPSFIDSNPTRGFDVAAASILWVMDTHGR